MNSRYHATSHLGRGGIELTLPPSLKITPAFVNRLATDWQGRLQLAQHHNKPLVRVHELQKQLLLLKTWKAEA